MRKTLVVYLMSEPETPALAEAAVEGGADLIELGFPFSDPLAEGPVIRLASERALGRGMRTRQCLDCLADGGAHPPRGARDRDADHPLRPPPAFR